MNVLTMALPGASRMRNLYPLIERDATCSLIYDLERAAVLDVPEELQPHVASAIETGDPDEALLDWMIAEDLWTADGGRGGEEAVAPPVMTSWWSPGLVFRRGREIHARIDNASLEVALEALECIFKQSGGAERLILRLSWGGNFPATQTLEGIVVDANRRAALARLRELRYELSLDAWLVTPAIATFLADFPFHVRLNCGSFPAAEAEASVRQAWERAEKGVRRLSGLGDRLTVQCVLTGAARLRELWDWAKELEIRHLDPVRLEDDDVLHSNRRQYQRDLLAISDEICAELGSPQPAPDCQPLSRVVNQLMRGESWVGMPELSTAAPAWWADEGSPDPAETAVPPAPLAQNSEAEPAAPDLGYSLEPGAPEVLSEGTPCATCWARYLCSHSALPSSPVNASADRREPTEESCAFWRAEVETGLRFYHRLAHADPLAALRLFDEPEAAVDPLDRHYPLEQPKMPF